MFQVAIIEDDPPTSNQLKGWILAARPGQLSLTIHIAVLPRRASGQRALSADFRLAVKEGIVGTASECPVGTET
jgi:hypothetical protein